MTAPVMHDSGALGPWNPGIESALPKAFLHLSTMHRPETVSTSLDEARQLYDLSGLPLHKLTAFRPERLAVHELLIRVMTELSVPDGDRYTDLGENSRHMTKMLLDHFIVQHLPACAELHARLLADARALIDSAVTAAITPQTPVAPPNPPVSLWRRLFSNSPHQISPPSNASTEASKTLRGADAITAVGRWRSASETADRTVRGGMLSRA